MPDYHALGQLGNDLGQVLLLLFRLLLLILPLGLWCLFWLLAVNWRVMWPVLAQGAWAPVVLLAVMAALVWSRLQAEPCNCLGFVSVPNFWCQLGDVALLIGVALFCGWLQGLLHWSPPEISLEPPPEPAHGLEHAHGDAHH
jgi:hypothetical protein